MTIKQFIRYILSAPRIINKLQYIAGAIVDPNGFGFFNLMLENAYVQEKYKHMFLTDKKGEVFIDCGMNVGLITDIARKMDMEVYGFEPNPVAVKLLNKKYENDNLVHIYPCAVSNEEGEMDFYINPQQLFDQGATIEKEAAKTEYNNTNCKSVKVLVKKLTDVIKKDILPKHKHIHLLKIDIEGSEFGVVNDIINEGLYKDITYIVVETHERFFKNGKKMLRDLKQKIKDNNIENIYLDWI